MDGAAATPTEIVQTWLDRVSDTFFQDDFDGFAAAIDLPFVLTTQASRTVLTSRDDLRAGFDAWVKMIRGHRATHLIRTAREVQQITPNLITATYDSEMLRNGTRLVPGFSSWMMLVRRDGVWLSDQLISGVVNARYPFSHIKVDPNAPAPDTRSIPKPPVSDA
ncbi:MULTISPECIES: hypothetical protein [unclassified Meridianimarinicoccus]|uniref:hypothetical protein n=1 Tax=unclassified Meridianimarinicoccus TaxID=2923344 RepID=UPI001868E327|nr:hypothetical protein [Fluviibacterium sp. MJW13]